jgi:hypothetical protein
LPCSIEDAPIKEGGCNKQEIRKEIRRAWNRKSKTRKGEE